MTIRFRLKLGDAELEVEGEKEFVQAQIDKFSAMVETKPRVIHGVESKLPEKIVAEAKSGKSLAPAEWVRQKAPKTGTEQLVVLGKYLEEHRGQPDFGAAEINKIAGEARLKNIHGQYFTYATQQGLLRQTGKGRYALTLTGEDLVLAMPKASSKA
jgi:hypothetical protein